MPVLRIRYERLRQGMLQRVLAEQSGLRQELVSNIETGRLNPTDDELLRLANVLHVNPPRALLTPVVIPEPEQMEQRA